MNKKNNHIIIFLMGVIIIILGVLCILFASGTINLNNKEIKVDSNNEVVNDTSKKENEKSYVGEYEYQNSDDTHIIILDLLEDGTFYFKQTQTASSYLYGTYTIQDNKLTLNYKFSQSNAQGSYMSLDETEEYNFNEKNDILITQTEKNYFSANDNEQFLLKKSSDNCNIIKDYTNNSISLLLMEQKN